MCQDYRRNLGMYLFSLIFFGFHECFLAHTTATNMPYDRKEEGYIVIFSKIVDFMGISLMMMMMMNCFCGMVHRGKVFSLISSRDHCHRSSPSRVSDMPRAGFELAQNQSSGFIEWSCAVVITTTPRRHNHKSFFVLL